MKTKKFVILAVLLAGLLIAYAAFSVIFCYNTKPAVSEGEFPFSITYEYLGETKTISGVYSCKFEGSRTISGQHDRYWNGEITYTEGDNFVHKEETKTLAVQPHMIAGYFMGDPLHRDHYQVYGLEGPEPYAEYYDYENDISITDYDQDEELAAKIMYAGEDATVLSEKANEYRELQSSPMAAARRGYVDTIIEPADTRKYLIGAFEMLFTKREERPSKKHGTI